MCTVLVLPRSSTFAKRLGRQPTWKCMVLSSHLPFLLPYEVAMGLCARHTPVGELQSHRQPLASFSPHVYGSNTCSSTFNVPYALLFLRLDWPCRYTPAGELQ